MAQGDDRGKSPPSRDALEGRLHELQAEGLACRAKVGIVVGRGFITDNGHIHPRGGVHEIPLHGGSHCSSATAAWHILVVVGAIGVPAANSPATVEDVHHAGLAIDMVGHKTGIPMQVITEVVARHVGAEDGTGAVGRDVFAHEHVVGKHPHIGMVQFLPACQVVVCPDRYSLGVALHQHDLASQLLDAHLGIGFVLDDHFSVFNDHCTDVVEVLKRLLADHVETHADVAIPLIISHKGVNAVGPVLFIEQELGCRQDLCRSGPLAHVVGNAGCCKIFGFICIIVTPADELLIALGIDAECDGCHRQ